MRNGVFIGEEGWDWVESQKYVFIKAPHMGTINLTAKTNLDKGSQAVDDQYPKGPLCQEWLNKFYHISTWGEW